MIPSDLFSDTGNAPGMLVTIDGPNASGKTSIARALGEQLAREGGRLVHSTRQPSPGALGVLARRSEQTIRGRALACLVAADRHHQLATEIEPALADGATVLCDRYIESSLVLQRIDEVDTEFILAVNRGIRRPNLRIRLTASEGLIRRRLNDRRRGPERRFEAIPGIVALELDLYAQADELLRDDYDLPSVLVDTSTKDAAAHAGRLLRIIRDRQELT
jgi:dTMP kinase